MICRETARKQTGLDDGWVQLDVDKTGAWAAGDYKHVCIVTCHQVKKNTKTYIQQKITPNRQNFHCNRVVVI